MAPKGKTPEATDKEATAPTDKKASTEIERATPLQPGDDLRIKIDNRSTYPITARVEFDDEENVVVTLEDAPLDQKAD